MHDGIRKARFPKFVLPGLLFVLLCLLAPRLWAEPPGVRTQPASPLNRFTPAQQKLLLSGQSLYRPSITEPPAGGEPKFTASAYILINAPVEKSFALFCDFEKQYLYLPTIKTSKILSRSGNRVVIYKELDYPVLDLKYTHILTIVPEAHRVDFITDPKGANSVKLSAGSFQFERIDDNRTLFTYRMTQLDPGIQIPRFVQEYMVSRDLPQVTVNIKKYIESDGKWRK
jgi:hypothetical protein